jgi:predicted Zn finger-like uncharacterized protein
MILTCPSCDSQFVVDAAQIPPEGREVRCASCKHQWHASAQGQAAELTAPEPEPEPEAESAEQELSELIAFPDPEPEEIPEEPEDRVDALPEDAFAGDSLEDIPESISSVTSELLSEEALRQEPELISAIEESDANNTDEYLADEDIAPVKASLKPLMALAAALLLALIITSFFALRPAMQGPFGFVYNMFGSPSSAGLALSDVTLRERPSRSKARFTIEGSIVNSTQEPMAVPILRIGMLDAEGTLMQSREYSDDSKPIIAAGESYPFKASNLETTFKDRLTYFVIDIGNGGELRLRKPTHGVPNG